MFGPTLDAAIDVVESEPDKVLAGVVTVGFDVDDVSLWRVLILSVVAVSLA